MRLNKLQLSNILSFPYVEDIADAVAITFDPTLNILIGGNGSGKSTALETINFVFKRALFRHYELSESAYNNSSASLRVESFRINPEMQKYKGYFRLNPNWESETLAQTIRVTLQLDEIDKENFNILARHYSDINTLATQYSRAFIPEFAPINGDEELEITIILDNGNDTFSSSMVGIRQDVVAYLTDYELLRELVLLHNASASTENVITSLGDTFTMLSAFRNYHSFSSNTSLNQDPRIQLRNIRQGNQNRGINAADGGEPSIFSVVKLRLASHQYKLILGNQSEDESVAAANNLPMIQNINKKLEIIHLKCSIRLQDARSWSYMFEFNDTKHERVLGDINNLSAGQRSIIHLIFEAYGRDDAKGGVVVIDEPEIHLHYQFQYEYLRIMQDITEEQGTQYILVTHSDGFISYDTAPYIKRFSLDESRHSIIHNPVMSLEQKKMIEILDNKQSARALFGNKVVLVEGQDDRYFFRALFDKVHPELRQDVSIYDTGSKDSHRSWKEFFEMFGIIVYQIKDLDAAFLDLYNDKAQYSLKDSTKIAQFRNKHPNINNDIEGRYSERLYILKNGSIETYLGLSAKGLKNVMEYCEDLSQFIDSGSSLSEEVLSIIEKISM